MSAKKRKKQLAKAAASSALMQQPHDPQAEGQRMAAAWLAGDKQVFQRALDSKAKRVAEEGEMPFSETPPSLATRAYNLARGCLLLYVTQLVFVSTAEDFSRRSWGFFGTLWLVARLLFLLASLAYLSSVALLHFSEPLYMRWTATSRARWAKMYEGYYSRNHISKADGDRKAREYFPDCKVRQRLWHKSVLELRKLCLEEGADDQEVSDAIGSVFREGGSRAAKDDLIELLMLTKEERSARARSLATGESVPVTNFKQMRQYKVQVADGAQPELPDEPPKSTPLFQLEEPDSAAEEEEEEESGEPS